MIQVYDQVMGVKVYQKGKGKPKQTQYEKDNDIFVSTIKNENFNYPYISQGIGRYEYDTQDEFISYGKWLAEPRKLNYFDNPKVIIREIVNPRIFATFINYPAVVKNIAAVIVEKDSNYPLLFFLALINSKLLTYYVDEQSAKSSNKSYPSFNSRLLKELPIIECDRSYKEDLAEFSKKIISQTEKYNMMVKEVVSFISSKFSITKTSKKLQNWHELDFGVFLKELEKARKKSAKENDTQYKKLSLSEEAEWMPYFNEQKEKAQALKAEIDSTDKQIDHMVYELYGLTEEEIAIVEEASV
ncbi:TaqI-like C-terminal specificity domain-containing protein [Mesonia sp.]|uniref:TaqI-like C-terminal specificity domain-containing protein n=1 Tax=Mesonia sp. TaxID=1960830 RepID=UPI003F97FB0B